ncbi:MAG: D-glycero-beta-D-manno-heptose 1-phosphate adenylyltransferase [Vampirovibrionia bacterium]
MLNLIQEYNRDKKTIVTTNGCFDILHVGHLNYLLDAKKQGDILIVGINTDKSVRKLKGPTRPINNENDRALLVSALECVDYTFLFNEDTPDTFLQKIKPDIHVKGGDYTLETLPEAKTLLALGSKVVFIPLTEGKSSSNVIEKIQN